MKKLGFALVLALTLILVAATSHAIIEEKSSIVGSLLNQSSKPFSGVTVRLLDSFFLNEIARTVTDRNGDFIIPNLLPGLYLISIQPPSLPAVMKRIQVVSGTPTFIDVRPLLDEERLKTHSAWESLKWTIRTAERNPLRDDHGMPSESTAPTSSGFMAGLRNFQASNNINGQVGYVNVGSGFSDSADSRQSAQIAVSGEWDRDGRWSFNGNVLDGARYGYSASGDVEYQLSDHRIGTTFAANDLVFARYPDLLNRQKIAQLIHSQSINEVPDETRLWVSSVNLNDSWRVLPKISVSYGARIDYYGYMQDNMGYSPHVQVSYQAMPNFAVHGIFYRNLSAPGSDYQYSEDQAAFSHGVAFVPYGAVLQPEKTTGYEFGFDGASDGFAMSLFYRSQDISNKIAAVDMSGSPVDAQLQATHSFVIFNAADLKSQGLTVNVKKKITRRVSAIASYDVSQSLPMYIVEKRVYSSQQLYFMQGDMPQFFHDLIAGVEANFYPSGTSFHANWKWSSGSPLVFGRKDENNTLTAIDVEVHQQIPLHGLSRSQLELLLAVKNLLDQNQDNAANADYMRALQYGMPRTIAGGVLLKF